MQKSATKAPGHCSADFQLAEFTGSLSSQLLLQAKEPAGDILDLLFCFPSKSTAVGIRGGLCDSGGKNQQSKLQAKEKKGKELRKTSYKGKTHRCQ